MDVLKVSVIVTTYNSPVYLRRVLDSFLCQERQPDEIVIADDGSGDETGEVIRESSAKFGFPLLHVWQEHRGFRAGKIRNKGIAASSGDYIILVDGDCIVNHHFISDHLSLAQEGCFLQGKRVLVNKKAVAFFSYEHANSFGLLWKIVAAGGLSNVHHLLRLPFPVSFKNKKLAGIKSCNMSFFRKDVIAVNGFDEDYVGWGNEDSDLACRLIKYGLMKKTPPFMAICFHLWHPTNKAAENMNKRLLENTIRSDKYFCENGLFKKN